jgi:hypothetical protein
MANDAACMCVWKLGDVTMTGKALARTETPCPIKSHRDVGRRADRREIEKRSLHTSVYRWPVG